MNENKAQWTYDVTDMTEDRSGDRTSTQPGKAARLLGVDGRNTGGLNPHPGFRMVTEMFLGWNNAPGAPDNGHVHGWFPITFRISNSQYAYGFVYRAVKDDGTLARYRVVLRIGDGLLWYTEQDFDSTAYDNGLLADDEAYAGEQMDVREVGTFVYVARAGKPLFMFYLTPGTQVLGAWDLKVVEDLGPGDAPVLQDNLLNGFSVADRLPGHIPAAVIHPDMAEVLTDLDPPVAGDAEARLVYVGMSGLVPVSNDNINFQTNPNLSIRHVSASDTDRGVPGPGSLMDEHSNVYWATPPQADPVWADKPGTPTFTYPSPSGELTGWVWAGPQGDATEPIGNLTLSWVWAYRLWDSRTGRFSPISNRVVSSALDAFGAEALFNDGTGGSPFVTFPMLDIVWDSSRFDTVLIYRGVFDDTVSISADDVILHLDSVVVLETYALDTQPGPAPWRRAAYFTQLSDAGVEVQPTWQGDDSFFSEPPRAGSLILYEGTMMYGKTATLNVEVGGLGLVFFSDLRRVNVELVPPLNRYPLRVANEEVSRFCAVGKNVVGLTRSNCYLFNKFNFDLQGFPAQKGFGVAGDRAAAEVGSRVFFMTTQGLYLVTATLDLSEATAVHWVVFSEWAGHWSGVHLAYDAHMGVLCMHNPDLEHTVFLWERTSKITELIDTVFIHAMEGQLPDDEEVAGSPLLDRAIFLQEAVDNNSTFWRVYTMDYDRRKGNTRLLDPESDALVSVDTMAIPTSVTVIGTLGLGLYGCYLYVLEGDDAGAKAKIVGHTGLTLTLAGGGIPVQAPGTRLGISPVFMQWTGHEIGMDEPDQPAGTVWQGSRTRQGRAVVKNVDQIGCTFADVRGDAVGGGSNDARFQGAVFRGNSDSLEGAAFPVDPKGRGTKVESVVNGPSEWMASLGGSNHGVAGSTLFPVVSIFCPDLYYTLLEVRVSGTILASQRERRTETRSP